MNSFVLVASLAIVALAILVPSDAAPGVDVVEAHKKASSLNTDKDSTVASKQKVTDIGDKLVIQSEKETSESDDWDASSSSEDYKEVDTPNGKVKVKSSKSSTKSVDTDKTTKSVGVAVVDDPTEC